MCFIILYFSQIQMSFTARPSGAPSAEARIMKSPEAPRRFGANYRGTTRVRERAPLKGFNAAVRRSLIGIAVLFGISRRPSTSSRKACTVRLLSELLCVYSSANDILAQNRELVNSKADFIATLVFCNIFLT